MNQFTRVILLSFSLLATAVFLPGVSVASVGQDTVDTVNPDNKPPKTAAKSSWTISHDNDIFVPGGRDQDYTYGINMTFAGKGAKDHWVSLHQPLDWIDKSIGLDSRFGQGVETRKIEYGLFGFTPEDITQKEAIQDDRPYASLVYVASSSEHYDRSSQVSWQSTLTFGVLGLSIVGDIQDSVHAAKGVDIPMGWNHQISNGGELTARYSVSRQSLLFKSGSGFELKNTYQGSVGYITEASWSLSARAGKIHTPWTSFNPELTSYGEKSTPAATGKVSEHYVWAGISLKARLYNVFLQGQFRDSAVTYDSDEINHGIVEAWVGYTVSLFSGYSFTYSIRGHTSELKQGQGNRNVVWGGVKLTKTFN
jgi:hypothetical protein